MHYEECPHFLSLTAPRWYRVKRNKDAGGVDGVTLAEFEEHLDVHLDRLHEELKTGTYQPMAVRQKLIPKAGQPGKFRPLGLPAIYDRVCQQKAGRGQIRFLVSSSRATRDYRQWKTKPRARWMERVGAQSHQRRDAQVQRDNSCSIAAT